MTDTTQAIRDALAARSKTTPYGIAFTGDGWTAFDEACSPEAITALLAELDAARAGIEAAVLAEKNRCYAAVLDTSPQKSGESARLLRFDVCSAINRGAEVCADPVTTGWPPAALMQDDCRKLSKALSNMPGARLSAQDASDAIRDGVKS